MPTPNLGDQDYYVYSLFREDGITSFWIGKGRGDRIERSASVIPGKRSYKNSILKRLYKTQGFVLRLKLLEGLTNADAKQIEKDLIQLIGRHPKGPLANITPGGDGGGMFRRGYKRPPEVVEKIRLAVTNPSPQTRAKMSASAKTRGPISAETRAKLSAAVRRRPPMSTEARAQIGARSRGKKLSSEARAKIAKAARNRDPAVRERMSAAQRGKRLSAEHRAKISAAGMGRKRNPLSDETKAKIAAAHRGRKLSEEHRLKLVAAGKRDAAARISRMTAAGPPHLGKKHSDESKAKMKASRLAYLIKKRSQRQ